MFTWVKLVVRAVFAIIGREYGYVKLNCVAWEYGWAHSSGWKQHVIATEERVWNPPDVTRFLDKPTPFIQLLSQLPGRDAMMVAKRSEVASDGMASEPAHCSPSFPQNYLQRNLAFKKYGHYFPLLV